MFSRQYYQDSYTLDNYIHFIHKNNHLNHNTNKQHHQQNNNDQSNNYDKQNNNTINILNKQQSSELINIEQNNIHKIQYFAQRKRKLSNQLSLFSWLIKDKPTQSSLLQSLYQYIKNLIRQITYTQNLFLSTYLISNVFIVSSVCSYFLSCSKHLWIDTNYFELFETDKYTSQQLNKVIQKSKLNHIKQLKHIYLGKNIKKNRQKIKMRVMDNNNGQSKNCVLQIFCISPKIKNGTVFIMDSHLQNILNSSYKGLKCIQLHRCPYIKNFKEISKCIQLQKFSISYNQFVTTQSLTPIFKRCLKLEKLEISECKNLDQNVFKQLKNIQQLRSLTLRFFKQSFGNLSMLSNCQHLQYLNIDDSLITDDELMSCVREIKSIKSLSIQGCALLTNMSLQFLLQRLSKNKQSGMKQLLISRIGNMDRQKIQKVMEIIYRNNLDKQQQLIN